MAGESASDVITSTARWTHRTDKQLEEEKDKMLKFPL